MIVTYSKFSKSLTINIKPHGQYYLLPVSVDWD
jgi:hypothetical protein